MLEDVAGQPCILETARGQLIDQPMPVTVASDLMAALTILANEPG